MSRDASSDNDGKPPFQQPKLVQTKPAVDVIERLTSMSNRTNLMALETTLGLLPGMDSGFAASAAEVRAVAKRMIANTEDFARILPGEA